MSSQLLDRPHPVTAFAGQLSARLDQLAATPVWSMRATEQRDTLVELARAQAKLDALRLRVLAEVDAELCAKVAAGLGLPAPDRSGAPIAVTPSPALSQIPLAPGGITGRVVGVVASSAADLVGIAALRKALLAEKAVLRVIAPTGGTLHGDRSSEIVERTLLTTRSVEFDAVVVTTLVPPAADARQSRDAKAGAGATPRILLVVMGTDAESLEYHEKYVHTLGLVGGHELVVERVAEGTPFDESALDGIDDRRGIAQRARSARIGAVRR